MIIARRTTPTPVEGKTGHKPCTGSSAHNQRPCASSLSARACAIASTSGRNERQTPRELKAERQNERSASMHEAITRLSRRLDTDRAAARRCQKMMPSRVIVKALRLPVGFGALTAYGGTETDLTASERARLKELEREVHELRAETAFLKKASAYGPFLWECRRHR